MAKQQGFEINGEQIAPGSRRTVEIPVSTLTDDTPVHLSVHVIHGRRPGPVLFVSAAIHGDEVIGVEIMRRLLRAKPLDSMAGTLLAVPIVNTFGFLNHSRYLPDRRDLNRCFPGLSEGSMASRLAHIFMSEVVRRADVGIDLHSAAIHRTNLPQIRLSPSNTHLAELGRVFGAPVMMTSKLREGSLRMAAEDAGVDVLLYEGGEGLRFDELAARAGVSGILRVMHHLGMIARKGVPRARHAPVQTSESRWYRAPAGGLARSFVTIGEAVTPGTVLGAVSDPFGQIDHEVVCEKAG
ncbi:MAG: succinylglutamate desuccinylase/aspartoacylase family protein, partial [Rhodobacteraceae bacterium]|nr:succinylglutamate desuccinylase/aspartoacylase family protein [Paracoccaceae bacterium]